MTTSNNTAIKAALLSTTLISLAPNLLLLLFPNINYTKSSSSSNILKIGQCLAAGGLLGDVFLHTLPHSMEDGDGDKVGIMVLVGFSVFLVMDVIVRIFGGDHHHHHHHSSHSHDVAAAASSGKENGNMTINGTTTCNNNSNSSSGEGQQKRFLSSSVLLNLTADALHNFTDGLAIGASYAASSSLSSNTTSLYTLLKSHGGLASLSILLHEIPHELGDFAVLVSHGFSRNEAMGVQFCTACAAFLGTIVGLVMGGGNGGESGSEVLLPFTSGGFVYLACVTILPEVLEEEEDHGEGKRRRRSGVLKERILQLVAFGVGIGFMCMVSMLENMEGVEVMGHSHGHHHGHGHEHHHHGHHHGDDL